MTHREWADGPRDSFALALLAGLAAAALLLWWSGRAQVGAWQARAAIAVGVLLALLPVAVHSVRLLNRAAVVAAELPEPIAFGRVVTPILRGEATFAAEPAVVLLRAPAGSEGYLEVKRPALGSERWELPRALMLPGGARAGEQLTWTAEIERDNTYFVVLDAEPLLIQVRPSDVFVQARGAGGRIAERSFALPSGAAVRGAWSFTHTPDGAGSTARLVLDGREVWAGRLDALPRHLRLGETRTDREHGGTLRLTALRYERRVAR